MTAPFREASITEYIDWLTRWLDHGDEPTHFYDYPWQQAGFLVAQRDFTTGDECGANARRIIVPDGVRHLGGGLGHNQLFLADGAKAAGGRWWVPVYSDAVFAGLPGVAGFIARARSQEADAERRRAEEVVGREASAAESDVTAWIRARA